MTDQDHFVRIGISVTPERETSRKERTYISRTSCEYSRIIVGDRNIEIVVSGCSDNNKKHLARVEIPIRQVPEFISQIVHGIVQSQLLTAGLNNVPNGNAPHQAQIIDKDEVYRKQKILSDIADRLLRARDEVIVSPLYAEERY